MRKRVVVVGTLAGNPYAGMAWMHMQIVVGLLRIGCDAYYLETTSTWPYDPMRDQMVDDSDYSVPYLAKVAESFGLGDRWAYRRSYGDKAWLGLAQSEAEDLLAHAALVLNVAGATRFAEEGLKVGRLVYFGTDPVFHEIDYDAGDARTRALVDEHQDVVTYGENIGTPASPIPSLPRLRARCRQPVLLDLWPEAPPSNPAFTTVANWRQGGRDVRFHGETYTWSKHHEFLKFLELPRRAPVPLELAMNLADRASIHHGSGAAVPALGLPRCDRRLLASHGWRLVDAPPFTLSPWTYRDYVMASRGEFTVARDLNVRLQSGWFSERSACYLAAGRPVVTQDTGFGTCLPTGTGLFAVATLDEAVAALEMIERDYERHRRAARAIAEEYFRAETVLTRVLRDLGV
jgi:hypothetical protein